MLPLLCLLTIGGAREDFLAQYQPEPIAAAYSAFEINYQNYHVKAGRKVFSAPIWATVGPGGYRVESINANHKKIVVTRNQDRETGVVREGKDFTILEDHRAEAANQPLFLAPSLWVVQGRPYREVVNDPSTTVLALLNGNFRGQRCKELVLTFKPGGLTADQSFFFDPERNWVCLGWRGSGVEDRYDYENWPGFPTPALVRAERWFDRELRFGLEVLAIGPKPGVLDSEFRIEVNPRNYWFFAITAFIAVSAAVFAIILTWRNRTRLANPPAAG